MVIPDTSFGNAFIPYIIIPSIFNIFIEAETLIFIDINTSSAVPFLEGLVEITVPLESILEKTSDILKMVWEIQEFANGDAETPILPLRSSFYVQLEANTGRLLSTESSSQLGRSSVQIRETTPIALLLTAIRIL